MNLDLSGKVLLVTGSTQGVGADVARLAAGCGIAAILITGRDADRAARLVDELAGQGVEAAWFAADLSHTETPGRIVDYAMAVFGRIDLLVNAAGLTDRAGWQDATPADWDRLFAVNARAPFFLMQRVIADLRRRGAEGAIVNILSMNAHCGTSDLAIYSATKGALATLTRNAAHACMADRIRVNGINMGWADTEGERRMQADVLGKGPGWLQDAAAAAPLGRLLTSAEVARMAIFMLSAQSGLLTGALVDLEQSVLGAPVDRIGAQ